jgi:2-polyprenyl-6-methoxyphenol hydroxylase-like FAD-dependent oxidoreductase
MQSLTTDVLIVGAGPAGLAVAAGLAAQGVDFLIIDALPQAQRTSRAAVIHAATLEALRDLGLADRLIAQGIRVPHFRIRERDAVLLHVDFSMLESATPYALMIPQDESERIMIDRLEELGHTIHRPATMVHFTRDGNGIKADSEDEDGRFTVRSRFLVGADGASSTVRQVARIAFPGHAYGSFMLADVRMRWPIERTEVSLFFSRDGTLVVAPMSRDRYRVVAQLANAPETPGVDDVQRVIDARGPRTGARVEEVLWGSRFQVHHKLADRFRDGPVLLVGDAAHVHSPAGGQGMNLGLRDARSLAQSLVAAIRHGRMHELDGYAATRRHAAGEVLRMTDRLTRIATVPGRFVRVLRNAAISTAGRFGTVRDRVARALAGME